MPQKGKGMEDKNVESSKFFWIQHVFIELSLRGILGFGY